MIIDSQPLTVALLAALLFGERLRPAGIAGLGVGVLGLCLLEVPPEAISGTPLPTSCSDGLAGNFASTVVPHHACYGGVLLCILAKEEWPHACAIAV